MAFVLPFALLFQGVRLVSLGLLLSLLIRSYVDGVMTAFFQLNPTAGIAEFLTTSYRLIYAIRESTLQSSTEPLRVSF